MKVNAIGQGLGVLVLCQGVLAGRACGETMTEAALVALARQEGSVAAEGAALKSAEAALGATQTAERYRATLFGSGTYGATDRKQANQFQPVMTPTKNAVIGVRKQMARGLSGELSVFGDEVSTKDGAIDRAATIGTRLAVRADLYKNLWGRLDQLELGAADHAMAKQELRNYVDQRRFETQVRKTYWALAANRASKRVTERMEELAEKQLQEAERRRNLSVAEQGEIARYRSQLYQAKTALIMIEYEYQKLMISIQELVPALVGRNLEPDLSTFDQVAARVGDCTEKIRTQKAVPWEFTKIDEIIGLAESIASADERVAAAHDAPDLNLLTEMDYTGVDQGLGEAAGRFADDGRFGYRVGIELSMPIGAEARDSRAARAAVSRRRLSLETASLRSSLAARHEQMSELIALLYETSKLQGGVSESLEEVVRDAEAKYDQARATVDQIIRDQNALQASLLDTIRTRQTVVSELLDYLADFTETPCGFNQL